jgi:hypothetical protein
MINNRIFVSALVLVLISSPVAAQAKGPLAPHSLVGAWCAPGSSEIDMRITRQGELIFPKNTRYPRQPSSCRLKKITPENDAWWHVQWTCKNKSESFSEHLRTIGEWDDPPTTLKNRQLESRTMPTGHGHLVAYNDCSEAEGRQ